MQVIFVTHFFQDLEPICFCMLLLRRFRRGLMDFFEVKLPHDTLVSDIHFKDVGLILVHRFL